MPKAKLPKRPILEPEREMMSGKCSNRRIRLRLRSRLKNSLHVLRADYELREFEIHRGEAQFEKAFKQFLIIENTDSGSFRPLGRKSIGNHQMLFSS
jgi:hypothetical protein